MLNLHIRNIDPCLLIMLVSLLYATFMKNSYLDDSAHKLLMIPHTNFEMFDDSAYEYCIHPGRLSVLTEYMSLSLTHFTPINLANHFIYIIGPIPFQKETCFRFHLPTSVQLAIVPYK